MQKAFRQAFSGIFHQSSQTKANRPIFQNILPRTTVKLEGIDLATTPIYPAMNRRKLLRWTMASLPLAGLTQEETLAMPPGRLPAQWPKDSLSQSSLQHHYTLFTSLCHRAALPFQDETLARAELIYQLLHAWRPSAPPETEFVTTSKSTVDHALFLTRLLPTIELRRDNGKWSLSESVAKPIPVTTNLPRIILIRYPGESDRLELGELLVTAPCESTFLKLPDGSDVGVPVRVTPAAIVRGRLFEANRKTPWPGRVWALGSDGQFRHDKAFAGIGTVSEKPVVFRPAWRKLPFFYSNGTFEVAVPPGKASFTLERGFEHELVHLDLELKAGEIREISLTGKRIIDMRDLGWVSGDTHVHWAVNAWDENEDPELLRLVQRAEDVRVVNNLTLYQWRPKRPFTKPDHAPMGPLKSLCDDQYLVQMGEEFRNDNQYGHINLLNLREIIHPISTGPGSGGDAKALDYPINKTIIEQARKQGAVVCEAHNLGPFGSSAVPIHVVLGLCDCLDQLEPQHYYRFLDCGFRIGLGNGSDHPARLVGCCRVYARSQGPFSFANWVEGLRRGRTFTTSGPLLFLQVDDTQIGDTLNAHTGQVVRVRARALSRKPLGTFEVISNNEVLKTTHTEKTEHRFEFDLPIEQSRWITARVARGDNFDALSGPDIAHTSAIYLTVDDKPVFRPEAADWWINNIRQHRERLRLTGNFATEEQRQEALAFADAGIARYQSLINQNRG